MIDFDIPAFYTQSPYAYVRRKTREVNIGGISLGGSYPIRIQSMTNVPTLDTQACVAQIERLVHAGSDYVRLSTPSMADAKHLSVIKTQLKERKLDIPLIADVHFNAKVAEEAARRVEKVRINPGNYIDKKTDTWQYTEKEYTQAIEQMAEELESLLKICKQYGTVVRIGTNHGSLSQRILSRYGNTPLGMAISAMEFVAICHEFGFHDIVLSMKASNTKIMIQSVRLLAAMLDEKKWNYPLHIGLTEAGDGAYGRIKSAAGMLPLLADGIGDTIRVSLTEDPENEIPFAKLLSRIKHTSSPSSDTNNPPIRYNPYVYTKRETSSIDHRYRNAPFIVSDYINIASEDIPLEASRDFVVINDNDVTNIKTQDVLVFEIHENTELLAWRKSLCRLIEKGMKNPIVWKFTYKDASWTSFYAKAAGDVSTVAIDGFVDGICLINPHFSAEKIYQLSLQILQACGLRFSQAEYIACPSCGRTQYAIQDVLAQIKAKTSHLHSLKIGIMGCIVNGPGEMADADYGFVGSAKGSICLYKGQQLIKRNVDQNEAIDALITLIKEHGDWIDP
ncbi:MAG: (E)-4-hydroxy-3-methylbut-2-enyl-diphosphate synthase [Bacteroidales bacterium]|nr:(E)-4-hydroxy-3-methylbut-2-enyl-diphosphate synthase [Bacteroidales bacterium]